MTQALSNPIEMHTQTAVSSVDRFGFTLFVADRWDGHALGSLNGGEAL
ncbi:MAG: hypothetical protein ACJAWL_002359 [Motiliproteus sp.]|jgi:hypothetical protein